MTYSLISAQSYVIPPPELWQERLPAPLKDAGPRPSASGSHWLVGPAGNPTEVQLSAADYQGAAPRRAALISTAASLGDIPRPAWDPAARLAAQSEDGIDGEILFCLPQIMAAIHLLEDQELQVACVEAYNQWLADFCAAAPERLVGLGQVPVSGVADAVASLEQWVGGGKLRGVQLRAFPNGSAAAKADDDPFWSQAIELGAALAVDRKFADSATQPEPLLKGALFATPGVAAQLQSMLYAGTLDRHPTLKLTVAGVDAGWVPVWYEATDNNYMRTVSLRTYQLEDPNAMPSDYFRRHFHYTVSSHDSVAVRFRRYIGLEDLMWCSRFPRSDSDWPNNRTWAERWSRELPEDVKRALLADNAARIYRLPGYEESRAPETEPVKLPHLLTA